MTYHHTLLDFITLITLSEVYILCIFLHPFVISSLSSKYSLQHFILKHPQSKFLP